MHICWEAITAIATSLTVLAAITGGTLMMYLLTKPRVTMLSASPIGWFYRYEDGNIVGTGITVKVKLKNRGSERTSIEGLFIDQQGRVFASSEPLLLEGHGVVLDTIMLLYLRKELGLPEPGENLCGVLKLEAWGNRRLLFFGHKYLTVKLSVVENQGTRTTI